MLLQQANDDEALKHTHGLLWLSLHVYEKGPFFNFHEIEENVVHMLQPFTKLI